MAKLPFDGSWCKRLSEPNQLDEAIDLREQIALQLLAVPQAQQMQTNEEPEVTLESPW